MDGNLENIKCLQLQGQPCDENKYAAKISKNLFDYGVAALIRSLDFYLTLPNVNGEHA